MPLFFAILLFSAWLIGDFAGHAKAAGKTSSDILVIENVTAGGVLMTANEDALCLAGIWAPTALMRLDPARKWQLAWREIIEANTLIAADRRPSVDRYACEVTNVMTADGKLLQHALLAAGWALVDPTSALDQTAAIDVMLGLEDKARKAGLGIWRAAESRPRQVEHLEEWIGTRLLVEGHVRRVHSNDRYVYLNFGADWRTDFTARLDRKMVKSAEINATHYNAKTLRLRGVLEESRGALMTISHLKQIEFLP